MFLRRIIHHVSTQNWTAIWLDLIIVVVGVFLGLQVQEWAQERDRRQLETTYTERLHDEVVDLQETRRYLVDIRAQWAASMRSVTPLHLRRRQPPDNAGRVSKHRVVIHRV